MKALKKIGTALICIPGVLLFLFIGWELFGMAVNNIEANWQTEQLISEISNVGEDDVEILDTYTFVGNHSGTGNHCDIVSAAIVRTERYADLSYHAGQWCEIFRRLSDLNKYDYENWSRQLDFPEDETNCYLLIKIESALFKDNIQGH